MPPWSSNNCWSVMRSSYNSLQTPTGSVFYLFLIGSAFYFRTPLGAVLGRYFIKYLLKFNFLLHFCHLNVRPGYLPTWIVPYSYWLGLFQEDIGWLLLAYVETTILTCIFFLWKIGQSSAETQLSQFICQSSKLIERTKFIPEVSDTVISNK